MFVRYDGPRFVLDAAAADDVTLLRNMQIDADGDILKCIGAGHF